MYKVIHVSTVSRFPENKPGPDFIKGFLKRHPNLSVRTANMIKRSRAGLSVQVENTLKLSLNIM